jgi:hypothetical protein
MRNAAGGIYETSVHQFARACIAAGTEALQVHIRSLSREAWEWSKALEAQIAAPAVVAEERDRLRAAQAAAVMPLIGPLLDAWEGADHDALEDQTELVKQIQAINFAMETAGESEL